MEGVVYKEMAPEENELDWTVTNRVMTDRVLMKTLQDSQSGGEKHAVIALVERGELKETYVTPEAAVKKSFPFHAVTHAFSAYEIGNGVCLLIVRDGKAVISLNGLM